MALRLVHTLIQTTVNRVVVRFYVFAAFSLVLAAIAARDVAALFS